MYNNEKLIIDLSVLFQSKNSNSSTIINEIINLRIFEYLLQNLSDTSGNSNNLIVLNQNASLDSLFDFQFDSNNLLNDNSENNNDLVEFNPININYTLFNYSFSTLNDNSGNNNNLVEI